MADGVLIVRWPLGGTPLDSGFRADDPRRQADFDRRRARAADRRPAAGESSRSTRITEHQRSTLMTGTPQRPALLVLEDGRTYTGGALRRHRRGLRRGRVQHRDDRLPGDADRPVVPPSGGGGHRAADRQHRLGRRRRDPAPGTGRTTLGQRVAGDLGGRATSSATWRRGRPTTGRHVIPAGGDGTSRGGGDLGGRHPRADPAPADRRGDALRHLLRRRAAGDEVRRSTGRMRDRPRSRGAAADGRRRPDRRRHHRRGLRRAGGRRGDLLGRRDRPRDQGEHPADAGRARHPHPCAAGDARPSSEIRGARRRRGLPVQRAGRPGHRRCASSS